MITLVNLRLVQGSQASGDLAATEDAALTGDSPRMKRRRRRRHEACRTGGKVERGARAAASAG